MSAITETRCYAAELLWEKQAGEMFRQAMRAATRRDCVCHQEKPCWLMDRALELLAPTISEEKWNASSWPFASRLARTANTSSSSTLAAGSMTPVPLVLPHAQSAAACRKHFMFGRFSWGGVNALTATGPGATLKVCPDRSSPDSSTSSSLSAASRSPCLVSAARVAVRVASSGSSSRRVLGVS
jgi:hypothetical protein